VRRAARAEGGSVAQAAAFGGGIIFISIRHIVRKTEDNLMRIIKKETETISPNANVTVTIMGRVIEVRHMEREHEYRPKKNSEDKKNTKKIPFYGIRTVDADTGEIFETIIVDEDAKPAKTRLDNRESLKKSMRRLGNLLNANFEKPKNCKLLTMTYVENMTDGERLYKDTKKFLMRFRYYCDRHGPGEFEYVTCVEPQGRGSFHHHMLLIFPRRAPYVSANDLRKLWGFGRLEIKNVYSVDDLGAYLKSYLTDVPLDDMDNDAIMEAIKGGFDMKTVSGQDGRTKRIVKGLRLVYFPKNFKLYRASRGAKRPKIRKMTYREMLEKFPDYRMTYACTKELKLGDDYYDTITYQQFKKSP
jgi:hypothetical protein